MNPCPCGYLGDTDGRCHCTEDQVRRYRQKISGPLLDRIDIHIEVAKVAKEVFQQNHNSNTEDSRTVQQRVARAYQLQLDRSGKSNHKLTNKEVNKHCKIDDTGSQLLDTAISRLGLSARAIHRILKVARTIADLADAVSIDSTHLSEAISYRRLDRKNLV
jgi:magnesium chelatase family protein